MQSRDIARPRHLRLAFYALVTFVATVVATSALGFTLVQALAYCVAVYVVLNAINFNKVLSKGANGPPLADR